MFGHGKKKSKFYILGEEIKVNRSFSNYNIEKNPVSCCRSRMVLPVLAVAFVYIVIAIKTIIVCWPGYVPQKNTDENSLPQVKIDNPISRADILDRNGAIIATSLPTVNLYAKPSKVKNKEAAAAKLSELLPDMLYEDILEKLKSKRNFVYVKRNLSLAQRYQVYALGIEGLGFEDMERGWKWTKGIICRWSTRCAIRP